MTLDAAAKSAHLSSLELAAANAADWLADLVFPPTCGHCGRVDARFCVVCRDELKRHPVNSSQHSADHISSLRATGKQAGILASAVKAFKYEGATDLQHLLAQRLVTTLNEQSRIFDAAVSVPLHADRQRERGYNQAALLGEPLARALGIRFEPGLLSRIRNTSQQARLSSNERRQNVVGAFAADPAAEGLSILLIDDVVTTGATLSECAAALRAQNAEAVCGIAVTHA